MGPRTSAGELSGRWRRDVARPLRLLFEFELDEGRLRTSALHRGDRVAARLGLIVVALLLLVYAVPGLVTSGPSSVIGSGASGFALPNLLGVVTAGVIGVGWWLIVRGALGASRLVRLSVATVFTITNSFLVANLTASASSGAVLHLVVDLNDTLFVVAAIALFASVVDRWRAGTFVAVLLFLATFVISCGYSVADQTLRTSLATGLVEDLSVIILLIAPLLYLSGMAILSAAYAVGTTAAALGGRGSPRVMRWLVLASAGASLWLYVVRDRAQYWNGPQPWLVVVRAGLVTLTFVAVALVSREALSHRAEGLHDSASLSVAVLIAIPSIVLGVYVALFNLMTVRFLHIPFGVPSALLRWRPDVISALGSTGLRCSIFGVVVVVAVDVLRRPGISMRRRQFMTGVALLAGWIVWTALFDWLPGSTTSDSSLFAALVTFATVVVTLRRWRAGTAAAFARYEALILIAFILTSLTSLLRALTTAIPVESIVVFVAGTVLILVGKSQFTGRSSPAFPASARTLMWIGYVILSITVALWTHYVAGFAAFTDHLSTVSIVNYVAVPYVGWLVLAGRFREQSLEENADGEGDGEVDTVLTPARRTHRPMMASVVTALALSLGVSVVVVVVRGTQPKFTTLSSGVGVDVPAGWRVVRHGASAMVVTHANPVAAFFVELTSPATLAPSAVMRAIATRFKSDVTVSLGPTMALGTSGNFHDVAVGRIHSPSDRALEGQTFDLRGTGVAVDAVGLLVGTTTGWSRVSPDLATMEESLNTVQSAPFW